MVNIAGDHITNVISEDGVSFGLYAAFDMLSCCCSDTKVYDWLAAPDVSQNYNAARNKHLEKTGSWFLDSTEFSEWKKKPEGILCIYGARRCHPPKVLCPLTDFLPAGCGKTILWCALLL